MMYRLARMQTVRQHYNANNVIADHTTCSWLRTKYLFHFSRAPTKLLYFSFISVVETVLILFLPRLFLLLARYVPNVAKEEYMRSV